LPSSELGVGEKSRGARSPENAGSLPRSSASPVSDTNALVIFKEGFDVPYGDGTQGAPGIVDTSSASD
jgi:hypothetical protein